MEKIHLFVHPFVLQRRQCKHLSSTIFKLRRKWYNTIWLKLHSKRVEKIQNPTRNEWRRLKNTLETSGKDPKIHSKRVEKIQNYTRNELIGLPVQVQNLFFLLGLLVSLGRPKPQWATSSPLVSSVILQLPHSFRV